MKNKIWLVVGLFSFFTFAIFISANYEKELSISSEIEALASSETLPEVEIVCGSSDLKGRCWDGICETVWTPFGWYQGWVCNEFTGYTSDFCANDVPC